VVQERQHRRKKNIKIKKELEVNIRDEKGNIKIEILEKMVDSIIAVNPLIYERLARI
jgi:hypothetical protein